VVAVEVGFEPTEELPPHTLSRRAPSAARTLHRRQGYRSPLRRLRHFRVVSRWSEIADADTAQRYAARFTALAESGADVHGEANCCDRLLDGPSRILDAGCGTGRVAIRLAQLGHEVVGVDLERSMLDVARMQAPNLTWIEADLATLDLGDEQFDLVVAAGNVIPLLAAGTHGAAIANLAAALRPDGVLVTGFGLDVAHLPIDDVPIDLVAYDALCANAGLTLVERWGTWDGDPFRNDGYAVNVHQRQGAGKGGS
jgi:SAM-dependent methyltransferase